MSLQLCSVFLVYLCLTITGKLRDAAASFAAAIRATIAPAPRLCTQLRSWEVWLCPCKNDLPNRVDTCTCVSLHVQRCVSTKATCFSPVDLKVKLCCFCSETNQANFFLEGCGESFIWSAPRAWVQLSQCRVREQMFFSRAKFFLWQGTMHARALECCPFKFCFWSFRTHTERFLVARFCCILRALSTMPFRLKG